MDFALTASHQDIIDLSETEKLRIRVKGFYDLVGLNIENFDAFIVTARHEQVMINEKIIDAFFMDILPLVFESQSALVDGKHAHRVIA